MLEVFGHGTGEDYLMSDEPLDPALFDKIMRSVRIDFVRPMCMRVSKRVKDKVTDTHEFEIPLGAKVETVQKEVTAVVLRWKGGFEKGHQYVLERLE